MAERFCVAVCGYLRKELNAALASGDFPDVDGAAFPPQCMYAGGKTSGLKPVEVSATSAEATLVIGGSCVASAMPVARGTNKVRRVILQQCFHPVTPPEFVEHFQAQGAYLITPGWLKGWRRHLEQWGFDQETARDFFGESVTRLVLLDTLVFPDSSETLAEFAAYVGMSSERIAVGTGYFRSFLRSHVLDWRLECAQQQNDQTQKQLADYALAMLLTETLARRLDGGQVLAALSHLFQTLCDPKELNYVRVDEGGEGSLWQLYPEPCKVDDAEKIARLWPGAPPDGPLGDGFLFRILYEGTTLGVLHVDQLAHPERRDHYVNLGYLVAPICGLALSNSRVFEKLQLAEASLQKANEELALRATTDALTLVHNRRSYDERFSTEWRRASRSPDPISLVLADVDHFKRYNDTYGHLIGDNCLVQVAQAMKSQLFRAGDFLARYGGEEFVVLLPSTDEEGALVVAERMRRAVEAIGIPHEGSPTYGHVTLSLGVASLVVTPHLSPQDLMKAADDALYQAKNAGRNRVVGASGRGPP